MLAPWLELDGAAERVDAWSARTGLDLRRLGTAADAEEIKDTAVTQPLVVALSLLAYEELSRRVELPATTVVAGHSVGELAAVAMAGVLSSDDAVAFAAARGAAMAAACALEPTGMSAVLGGDPDQVLDRLHELGLDAANRNGAGQVVAAGPLPALQALLDQPPHRARVVRLPVAGAFHTRFMAPASEQLRTYARDIKVHDASRHWLSNLDGARVDRGPQVRQRLIEQVTAPVRWDICQAVMRDRNVTATVELPPAGTLTGLARRELRGIRTLAVKTPQDLDKVAELVRELAGSNA